jgi:hypothetical protein
MDGTLLERNLPERFWGRLRAKTGTLRGVQNIAGYFQFGDDVLVFAFMIRDDSRDWLQLQRAQDRALTDILDAYLEAAAPPATARKTLPQLPRNEEPPGGSAVSGAGPAPSPAAMEAKPVSNPATPSASGSSRVLRQPPAVPPKPEAKARAASAAGRP